jgi:hypothetical protein
MEAIDSGSDRFTDWSGKKLFETIGKIEPWKCQIAQIPEQTQERISTPNRMPRDFVRSFPMCTQS